jgi:hypothetical protein
MAKFKKEMFISKKEKKVDAISLQAPYYLN